MGVKSFLKHLLKQAPCLKSGVYVTSRRFT